VQKLCLNLKKVEKRFGEKNVLNGVTMDLFAGEIMGLIGPNGAGKTTLIKLIMGLLNLSGGSIYLFSRERGQLTSTDWSKIGYVSDEPNLYDFMTVDQIISFNSVFFPQWNSEKCCELKKRFQLPQHEPVKNLSRGMKAQLALILALCQEPQLLILDEPFDGLDPLRRIEFLNIILDEFTSSEDRTVFISSHYLEELERICDRVAFIHEGELKRVVKMEQLRVEEKTIRVVFQKQPPQSLLSMPGIKDIKKEGQTGYLLTVENNFNEIYQACGAFPHYVLEIYHRSIEDMFHDYS
jgi:ABC-2 type transport system ATP-binding protein